MISTEKEKIIISKLNRFRDLFDGDISTDLTTRILYATDASMYRMIPTAVIFPKSEKDIENSIRFCNLNDTSLVPRAAGTSLGGQCIGEGIILDVSRYLTKIIEVNQEEKWVRVQPGVVRDELNIFLSKYGLHFGPNTSTSNRAMIGGMVGNNSSGSYSIRYGTTRDNILSVKGYLSDGSAVEFGEMDTLTFRKKTHGTSLEAAIYRQISFELSHPLAQSEIEKEFPKKTIHRRNTGYAIDVLLDTEPFQRGQKPFNFAKMICGSEGTLMLISEIKLGLVEKPSSRKVLLCAHFDTLDDSLKAAVLVMKYHPSQCELMDKVILDCTKENIIQNQNRFFIEGDPAAILMIEIEEDQIQDLETKIAEVKNVLIDQRLGYAFPVLENENIQKAMQLRAAGLGVLQNLKGREKALEFVEDTAVDIEDLPAYIQEFDEMIRLQNTSSVYYAHAGAGEIHTRPRVDLTSEEGRQKFRSIAEKSAILIKKYKGSLSGEHGDGIIRSEFIPIVLGHRNYELIKRIKQTWDPKNIFNPGKIVDPYKMDSNIRLEYKATTEVKTLMNFQKEGGYLSAAEKCSGSGDCLKSRVIGGTLCPSYQATRNEKDSTRGRANILKEFFTHRFTMESYQSQEVYDILKLCLSCKACLSECPSSVDMSSLKAEFYYQYYEEHQRSRLDKNILGFYNISERIAPWARFTNILQNTPILKYAIRKYFGMDIRRTLPKYSLRRFKNLVSKRKPEIRPYEETIYLFVDEYIDFFESHIGIKTIELLNALDVEVIILPAVNSARNLISKGYLEEARSEINALLDGWKMIVKHNHFIVGIEPSAILGVRDDYGRLASLENIEYLHKIQPQVKLIEEYLADLFERKPNLMTRFTDLPMEILYHGHCHQKSLSSSQYALDILNFPKNYSAKEIPSGCCGMAGSFGYEHYDLSMQIGEMTLFPSIRESSQCQIAASGTSCRHQIKDGVQTIALHPIEILHNAINFTNFTS